MLNQELTLFKIPETRPDKKNSSPNDNKINISPRQFASLDNALSSIFPTEKESQLQKIKKHLGSVANELSNEQIVEISSKFQYLIDSWLDEFEKKTFFGKTLNEVLGGK